MTEAAALIEQQAAELAEARAENERLVELTKFWIDDSVAAHRAHTTAESERDELLREKERPGAGWRPIETAPKDGTTFLAYQAEEGVDFFHWQDFGADSTAPKGWRDSFIHVYPEGSENGPKHWMPLPVPPAAEQEAV